MRDVSQGKPADETDARSLCSPPLLRASATPAAACGYFDCFGAAVADDAYPAGRDAAADPGAGSWCGRARKGLSLAGFYNDPALALRHRYAPVNGDRERRWPRPPCTLLTADPSAPVARRDAAPRLWTKRRRAGANAAPSDGGPSMIDRPNSLAARDIAYYFHPATNARRHEQVGPMMIERGEGVRVYDDQGKEYIEGLAGLWSVAVGFGEQRLVKAAAEQMAKLPFYHSFSHKSHPAAVKLAERLVALAPGMAKAHFTSSGSEANDLVVKMIWYYNNALGRPQKKKIISRQKAYHGVTIVSGSLTGMPNFHRDFDLPLPFVRHVGLPEPLALRPARRDRGGVRDAARRGAGRDDHGRRAGDGRRLHRRAGDGRGRRDPAAAHLLGENPGGLPQARRADRRRRGHHRLRPHRRVVRLPDLQYRARLHGRVEGDHVELFPASARSCSPTRSIRRSPTIRRRSACSRMASPPAAIPSARRSALENLDIFEEKDLVGAVRRLAPHFQERLRGFASHPLVGEARGVGLVGALEFVADKASKAPFDPPGSCGAKLAELCHEEGLIIRAIGDVIAFCPPLIISPRRHRRDVRPLRSRS